MKILHIAAHLGGGAGKAISGLAIQDQEMFGDAHRVLLLQAPEKGGYVQECLAHNVSVDLWQGDMAALQWADVIVVSWWNHPTMARFLHCFPKLRTRLLLWSHVNGCHYPNLAVQFVQAFDGALFTSPYSLENPAWAEAERQDIRANSELVLGMGRFCVGDILPKSDYRQREPFVIGYAGTLNYGKLHPQFTSFCKAVCTQIPNVQFVMAGDRDAALEQDIQNAGLAGRFAFPGFVADVPSLMRSFDVFGYLLNPEHYGTTENVLLEAMACGVPPIVLRQNVEQFIVPSGGEYVVENPEQYGQRIAYLQQHPERRMELGRMARAHVQTNYDSARNTSRFQEMCRQALRRDAEEHDFSFLGDTPWQWFLYCLDQETRTQFEAASEAPEQLARTLARSCPPILREKRKSSLRHFAAVYTEDTTLQILKRWMEEENHGRN